MAIFTPFKLVDTHPHQGDALLSCRRAKIFSPTLRLSSDLEVLVAPTNGDWVVVGQSIRRLVVRLVVTYPGIIDMASCSIRAPISCRPPASHLSPTEERIRCGFERMLECRSPGLAVAARLLLVVGLLTERASWTGGDYRQASDRLTAGREYRVPAGRSVRSGGRYDDLSEAVRV